MLSGAGRTLILLIISAVVTAARKDVPDSLPRGPSREMEGSPGRAPAVRHPDQPHISGDGKKTLKTKPTLDNNTGLRKTDGHHGNSLPVNARSGRPAANQYGGSGKDRNQPGPILASPHTYPKGAPDYESNRPRKTDPRAAEATQNSSRAATNRHPASLLHHVSVFRREPDGKDWACVTDCHRERDEREAYCHSDFAVNGIVHDVDAVGGGVQLLSVLVNSGGFYKMNRLYITPDDVFFRVTVLVVNAPHCPQPCLHLQLGGRYIIMGQIYHKRMELPSSVQRAVSGRLRAGDGLVTSGRSFIRRFNRKKERKVLAATHAKCK
ncbi:UPF0450 protein C17orf58 homolog isoform X1 [Bufo bufo]|uniref:UPF0450 protein C17orf58 homolog isoform X1 n=2 Tax=Bufo bufo TaxID=8384 RepID=UPI001ABEA48A|nr:UPF0450 protein C17orf58 homolog isoform X1 [Bufo bufo]